MAYVDGSLLFSNNQAITATAASTSIVDLTGFGSGNAPNMIFGGSVYGADMGVGDGMAVPKILVNVTTSFNNLTSLTVAIQGAPDNGSNAPGTYITYADTGAVPLASLTAGTSISGIDLPQLVQGIKQLANNPLPRFLRLNYTVVGTAPTAGAVYAYIGLQRDGELGGISYASNFVVAA